MQVHLGLTHAKTGAVDDPTLDLQIPAARSSYNFEHPTTRFPTPCLQLGTTQQSFHDTLTFEDGVQ